MNDTNRHLLLLVILLSACTAEDTDKRRPISDSDLIHISATITGTSTRASTPKEVEEKAAFKLGDEIGIYIADYAGGTLLPLLPRENHANNVCHRFDGNIWSLKDAKDQEQMYWNSPLTAIAMYGYYPYHGLSITAETNMQAIPFAIQPDQSNADDYADNDLLCAAQQNITRSSSSSQEMEFRHALSKMQVNIRFNDEFKDLHGTSIVTGHTLILRNLYPIAAVDLLATDASRIAGPITTETPIEVMPYPFTTAPTGYDASYKAILVPQEVKGELIAITVQTVKGILHFNYTPPANTDGSPFRLTSGYNHQFNVLVGKDELSVTTDNSITWEDGFNEDQEEIVMNNTEFNGLEWKRYNLGASSVNYEYKWDESIGKYYQWGRNTAFTKAITPAETQAGPITTADIATYKEKFITNTTTNDWLDPTTDNHFWTSPNTQGPCPKGYRLPTLCELLGVTGNENNNDKITTVQIQKEYLSDENPSLESTTHYIFDPTPGIVSLPTKLYGLKKQGTNEAYLISWQRKNITAGHISYIHIEYWKSDISATFEGKGLEAIRTEFFTNKPAESILEFPCAEWIDKADGTYKSSKTYGYYWSSTPGGTTEGTAWSTAFEANGPQVKEQPRANGCSIRCVKSK